MTGPGKTHKPNKKRSFARNEDGVAAIEFAIVSVLFLTVLFGVVEASRIVWAKNTLRFALEQAARERLVDSTMTDEDIENFVLSSIDDFIDTSTITLTISTSTTTDGVDVLNLEGTFEYNMLLPVFPDAFSTFELQAESHMPLVSS